MQHIYTLIYELSINVSFQNQQHCGNTTLKCSQKRRYNQYFTLDVYYTCILHYCIPLLSTSTKIISSAKQFDELLLYKRINYYKVRNIVTKYNRIREKWTSWDGPHHSSNINFLSKIGKKMLDCVFLFQFISFVVWNNFTFEYNFHQNSNEIDNQTNRLFHSNRLEFSVFLIA